MGLEFENLNITVVGLGLIGGSMAKAIRKHINVKNLWAIEVNESIIKQSKQEGIIDEGFINPTYPLNHSDLVILCAYPNTNINFIKDNMHKMKKNCIITDTSGIKDKISRQINEFIREDIYFVGGHPMAGKECVGYEFSDSDIFEGASYILTCNHNPGKQIKMLKKLFYGIGFKEVSIMSPEKHDEMIAFTSQLPHLIACALVNSHKFEQGLDCMGGSFKDATRVAQINAELWSQLIFENKDKLLRALAEFIGDLNKVYNIIDNDNKDIVQSYLEKSTAKRKGLSI